jgi:hypothetical protein
LSFTVALTAPIDLATAAAGDVVVAKVRKPVLAVGSKDIVMPEGATVRGRIVRLQHWTDRDTRFDISIALESLEVGGISSPLHAVWDGRNELAYAGNGPGMRSRSGTPMPTPRLPTTIATFIFPTSKNNFIVPRGHESRWLTATAHSP